MSRSVIGPLADTSGSASVVEEIVVEEQAARGAEAALVGSSSGAH